MSQASNLRFKCTQCGKCCTLREEYGHVYLSRTEQEALAKLHEITLRSFRRRFTFTDEYGWTQLKAGGERGEHCIFLDTETQGCNVYEARPVQCRTFPFWREFVKKDGWSDEVREMCEGTGQGRLYSIEEAEQRMLEMEQSGEE